MKLFIYFMLLLAAACAVGLLIAYDPGYLLINYDVWTIETPLWFAVAVGSLLVLLLVAMMSLLQSLQGFWQGVMLFRRRHMKKRAKLNTERGFLALAEGCWRQAEQKLVHGIYNPKRSLLNYLGAAMAAQGQGNAERRDDYLRLANQANDEADLAIGLTQAKLQYEQGQYEQCLATLERLHRLSPANEYTMQLLQQVYGKLRDWPRLLEHLLLMKRRKLVTKDQYEKLAREISLQQLLKLQAQAASIIAWRKMFTNLPKQYQREEEFLLLYLPVCVKDDQVEVLGLIKEALKYGWSDQLIAYLGKLDSVDVRELLAYCEGWLKKYPNNAVLQLTLGRLCLKNQLWGKAQQHLNVAVAKANSAEACYELARLHKKLGDERKALHFFQVGLAIAIGGNLVEVDEICAKPFGEG